MNLARSRRVLGSALLGMAVFGTWAYVVNAGHADHRLTSALSQGGFSFVFSLVVMSITEGTFAALAGRRLQVALAIAVPTAISLGGASLVHLAAHPPSILLTLPGPARVGTSYQTAYVLNLRRQAGDAHSRPGIGQVDAA